MKNKLLLLTIFMLPFIGFSQIGVTESFDGGVPAGWINDGAIMFGSGTQACDANSLRANVYSFNDGTTLTTENYEAQSNGTDLDVSFEYKLVDWSAATNPTAPGWGEFSVEYSTDGGTTWELLETIDDDNHVTSSDCATLNYTIDAADIPDGSDFQFRVDLTWSDGDYYFYLDNFSLLQTTDEAPNCDAVLNLPADEATDVAIETGLSWSAATGIATEYIISVGTSAGGTDVVDAEVVSGLNYDFTDLLDYETTYYVSILPSNENGEPDVADCTEFSFTTEDDPSQTVVCADGPVNTTYCYGNNDDTEFVYTSDDGSSLNITFNEGSFESCCDDIIILDSDGSQLFMGTGDISGESFQSTGDQLTVLFDTDGSVSCDSGSYGSLDFDVSCATCINPQVDFELVDNCLNGPEFFIDVDVTDLGDASELEITDNQGEFTETTTEEGIVQMGPYDNGTDIVISVENLDDANCVVQSSSFTQEFCTTEVVDCDAGPITVDYCYGNNEDYEVTYISSSGEPLNLDFAFGDIEGGFDELIVLDTDGTQLASLDGDLTGQSFQSTGDEITVLIDSDGSVSCQSSTNYDELQYTVACATCVNPEASYEVVDDCASGEDQFFVDVDLTSIGDASAVDITDNQGNEELGVSQEDVYTFGPYDNGTGVQITIENVDDVNCIINSSSLTQNACPPDNSSCDTAEVATVNDDNFCVEVNEGTLFEATATSVSSSCHTNITQDVWYEFEATADTHMTSIQAAGGGTPLGTAIYADDCGDLTELYCSGEFDNNVFGVNNSNTVVAENLTVGETYYVRVYSFGGNDEDINFDLCITTPQFLEENEACTDIAPFCAPVDEDGNPEPLIFPNGYFYLNESVAEDGPDYDCLFTQPNPAWFYLTVEQAGDLEFQIVQSTAFDVDGNDIGQQLDVDFIAYGPFDGAEDNCDELTAANEVDCSYSGSAVEDMFIPGAEQGEIYVVLITNYNQSPGYISFNQVNLGGDGAGSSSCDDVFSVAYGCESDGLLLEAEITDSDAYQWYTVEIDEETDEEEVTPIDGEESSTFQANESGIYEVLALDEAGNFVTERFDVRLSPEAELDLPQDLEVCGDEVIVDGTIDNQADFDEITYEWYDENDNLVDNQAVVEIVEPGDYILEVTTAENAGSEVVECISTFELTVNQVDYEINLGDDIVTCDLSNVVLDASNEEIDPDIATYEWLLDGEVLLGETNSTLDVMDYGFGLYEVIVFVGSESCAAEDEILIEANDSVTLDLTTDSIDNLFCAGDIVTLIAEVEGDSGEPLDFQWIVNGEIVQESDNNTLEYEIGSDGNDTFDEVEVSVIVGTDCYAEDAIDLDRYDIDNCVVPQGISPNQDGINDSFDLSFLADRSGINSIEVYNRYGRTVFKQSDYVNEFNGQDDQGNNLVTGTYFYVIKFNQEDPVYGSEHKGWLYINREQ
ncbi:MAG: gliding motility-associated C-terminal domain-containing protein [Bacteroidota bacterium]